MAYYALVYDFVDDFMVRRTPFREEHLGRAREAHGRGELVLAGALADAPAGALLIFQGDSPQAAETFASNDPYVKSGLVTSWKVRPWTVVVGQREGSAATKGAA